MNSIIKGFSQCIDLFLQPLAQNLLSSIQNIIHQLELLEPYIWEPSYCWVSLDVTSLYSSILHDIGMVFLQYFLSQDRMLHPRQAVFILDAALFCLTHNYFKFDAEF